MLALLGKKKLKNQKQKKLIDKDDKWILSFK